jgi:hypothetical protein
MIILCQLKKGTVVSVRVAHTIDTSDQSCFLNILSVPDAAHHDMKKSILTVYDLSFVRAMRPWLNDLNVAIKANFFIHDVDDPVSESAKEISFTELQYAYRMRLRIDRPPVQIF